MKSFEEDRDVLRAEIVEPPTPPKDRWLHLAKLAMTVGIGTAGGAVFAHFELPLPWLLGALAACIVASLSPLPVVSARKIRPPLATVLGVLMGSAVTPTFLDRVATWPLSIALVILYTAVLGIIAFIYLHRVAGYDKVTAYFAGMPGGLATMIMTSAELGGDERKTALIQGCRIFLVVMTVPFVFQWIMDLEIGARGQFSTPLLAFDPVDGAILLACAVFGYPLGRLIRLPNPSMLGPALLSAIVHGLDWTTAKPPFELVIVAQIVLGTATGSQFKGANLRLFKAALIHTIGLVLLFYATGIAFAFMMWKWLDIPLLEAILSLAPGGMPEMILITMAVGGDVLFVVTHHLGRSVCLNFLAPILFKARRSGPAGTAESAPRRRDGGSSKGNQPPK